MILMIVNLINLQTIKIAIKISVNIGVTRAQTSTGSNEISYLAACDSLEENSGRRKRARRSH